MLGDAFTKTAAVQAVTATAVSASVIDLLDRKDFGSELTKLAFNCTVSAVPVRSHVAVTLTDANDLVGLATHALTVGTPIVFDTIATTTGLTAGTVYYVTDGTGTDADNFSVSTTLANALIGTKVALTTNGTANITVLSTVEFQMIGSNASDLASTLAPPFVLGSSGPVPVRVTKQVTFDATGGAAEDIVSLAAHGLPVGTPVVFSGGGTMPTGLTAGVTYYVTGPAAGHFQVASTMKNAIAGTAIDFTTDGSGVLFVQVADGLLTAGGPMIFVEGNPQHGRRGHRTGYRYLGARFVCAEGNLAAGSFSWQVAANEDQGGVNYPSGYEV